MSIADYYREHQLEDMAMSEESDRQYSKRPYWHTLDSTKVWIDEMDTLHISNALAHLESRSLGSCRKAEAMKAELEKRISK